MNKVTYNGKEEFVSFDQVPIGALVLTTTGFHGIKSILPYTAERAFITLFSCGESIDYSFSEIKYKVLQPGESVTLTVEGVGCEHSLY